VAFQQESLTLAETKKSQSTVSEAGDWDFFDKVKIPDKKGKGSFFIWNFFII
jgi:hypothetical protein